MIAKTISDICNQDENDECDNSANGCLSITTTTSAKNYDRIEVQKFKNQATSPNIPMNEKEDNAKREVYVLISLEISTCLYYLDFNFLGTKSNTGKYCYNPIVPNASLSKCTTVSNPKS